MKDLQKLRNDTENLVVCSKIFGHLLFDFSLEYDFRQGSCVTPENHRGYHSVPPNFLTNWEKSRPRSPWVISPRIRSSAIFTDNSAT